MKILGKVSKLVIGVFRTTISSFKVLKSIIGYSKLAVGNTNCCRYRKNGSGRLAHSYSLLLRSKKIVYIKMD